jgi:hypothetical protein
MGGDARVSGPRAAPLSRPFAALPRPAAWLPKWRHNLVPERGVGERYQRSCHSLGVGDNQPAHEFWPPGSTSRA